MLTEGLPVPQRQECRYAWNGRTATSSDSEASHFQGPAGAATGVPDTRGRWDERCRAGAPDEDRVHRGNPAQVGRPDADVRRRVASASSRLPGVTTALLR